MTKSLTKAAVGKLIVTNKDGAPIMSKSVHQILAATGEPMDYIAILALFDLAKVTVPGDDSNTKTHRIRRVRWGAYRLRKAGFAKITSKKGESPIVSLTAAGKKAALEAQEIQTA